MTATDAKGRIDPINAKKDCAPYAISHILMNLPKTGIVVSASPEEKREHFANLYDATYRKLEARQSFLIENHGTDRPVWKKLIEKDLRGKKIKTTGLTLTEIAERNPKSMLVAKTRRHLVAIIRGRIVSNNFGREPLDRKPTTVYLIPSK